MKKCGYVSVLRKRPGRTAGAAAQIPGELPRARRGIDEIIAHRTPGGLRQKSERKGPSSGSSRRGGFRTAPGWQPEAKKVSLTNLTRLTPSLTGWCWTLAVKSGLYLAYYQAETDLAKPTP